MVIITCKIECVMVYCGTEAFYSTYSQVYVLFVVFFFLFFIIPSHSQTADEVMSFIPWL